MAHEDIRERLAPIEGVNWSKVDYQSNEEHYGDWIWIDNKVLLASGSDEEALAEFMKHAVADMKRLLADLERHDG